MWKLVQRLKNFVTVDVRHDIILQYKTLPNNMLFFNLRSHRLKMVLHFPRPVSPTAAGFLRNLLLWTVKCSSFLQLQPCLMCENLSNERWSNGVARCRNDSQNVSYRWWARKQIALSIHNRPCLRLITLTLFSFLLLLCFFSSSQSTVAERKKDLQQLWWPSWI